MKQQTRTRLKRSLPHFALYAFTGLVAYAILRVLFLEFGLSAWQATVIALVGMMVLLEGLTRLGWLKLPSVLTNSDRT